MTTVKRSGQSGAYHHVADHVRIVDGEDALVPPGTSYVEEQPPQPKAITNSDHVSPITWSLAAQQLEDDISPARDDCKLRPLSDLVAPLQLQTITTPPVHIYESASPTEIFHESRDHDHPVTELHAVGLTSQVLADTVPHQHDAANIEAWLCHSLALSNQSVESPTTSANASSEEEKAGRVNDDPSLIPLPVCSPDSLRACSVEHHIPDQIPRSPQRRFEECWILNMSVNFKDASKREKFFVTYIEDTDIWRRVTISVKYADAPKDSLEDELHSLTYQSDKSHCIFDALCESLATIHFFDTVTNLKLVTDPEDGQLHVHVREDTNEIIDFPDLEKFRRIVSTEVIETSEGITCPYFREDHLVLPSHISGFVYKVVVNGKTMIRKDIPGRDSVEEFMYEQNALKALLGRPNVIQLCGLVTDKDGMKVKGLLIEYAPGGSLFDILCETPREEISTETREKWAMQIMTGLAEIHEAGFVQGDFTLSNIVIDKNNDARIIDINRRGCPLGWEPPELMPIIEVGLRVSMYISSKTDLYQLGIVLSALATHEDSPNQYELGPLAETGVSSEYQQVTSICLNKNPRDRLNASQLLRLFEAGTRLNDERLFVQRSPAITSTSAASGNRLVVTTDLHEQHRSELPLSGRGLRANEDGRRNASFETRTSSTHRNADSELSSAPHSRGRAPRRRDYRPQSQSRQTVTSGTSLSSLSTRRSEHQKAATEAEQPDEGSLESSDTVNEKTTANSIVGSTSDCGVGVLSVLPAAMPGDSLMEQCSPHALTFQDSGYHELQSMVSEVEENEVPDTGHSNAKEAELTSELELGDNALVCRKHTDI